MALIKCSECGQPISDRAVKCPKCGCPVLKEEVPVQVEAVRSKKSNAWAAIVAVLLLVTVGGYAAYIMLSDDGERETPTEQGVSDVSEKESEFDVKKFIMGYYDAVADGGYASYFEDDDITFFRLEHVSKDEVVKTISSSPKRDTSREYDWATLDVSALSSGATRAVFSSDYYIHYESRTDKYRITTEMVISPNRKIQSLKDTETVKMSSINNSNSSTVNDYNSSAVNSSQGSTANSNHTPTANAPSWVQGTWTYDLNSSVGIIASYKIEINGNTMSFYRNGQRQWSEAFSYENGQLVGSSHKLRVNESSRKIIDESGYKYNGGGASSSSIQFNTAYDVIGYLSGRTFRNTNNGSSLQIRQDGCYVNGQCVTAAPVVVSFSSYSATVRANLIPAGPITFYIDSQNGTMRDSTGETWR